jgi:uncharacterized membrane protein YhhN
MELKTIFLIAFIVFGVAHLASILFKNILVKAMTKGLLMPLLLGVYVFGAQNEIFWPVVLALVLGCFGDVFLLNIENLKFFRMGLASFLLGHVFYIVAMVSAINSGASVFLIVLIVSIAVSVALCFFLYRFVRPSADMKIPVIAYEAVIMGMAICALQVFLIFGFPQGMFVLAGSLFFLVSDSVLAKFTFGNKPWHGDFWVMLTYLPAQALITLGFCYL